MDAITQFSTKERKKVLDYVLDHPSEAFGVRSLARKLGLSPALVSRVLTSLEKSGMVRRGRLDSNNPEARVLKILSNVRKLMAANLAGNARKLIKEISGIGIYGSWASGENREDSDIDIWVRCTAKPKESDIAKLNSYVISRLRTESSILVLYPEKTQRIKKDDAVFYHSLLFGSIILWGEGLDKP